MTREEFVSSGGDQSRPASYSSRRTCLAWAQTFSEWDDQTWLAIYGDAWYTTMPASRFQPWMGRVIGRYLHGKRVAA